MGHRNILNIPQMILMCSQFWKLRCYTNLEVKNYLNSARKVGEINKNFMEKMALEFELKGWTRPRKVDRWVWSEKHFLRTGSMLANMALLWKLQNDIILQDTLLPPAGKLFYNKNKYTMCMCSLAQTYVETLSEERTRQNKHLKDKEWAMGISERSLSGKENSKYKSLKSREKLDIFKKQKGDAKSEMRVMPGWCRAFWGIYILF